MAESQYEKLFEYIDNVIIRLEGILQKGSTIDNIKDNHIKLTMKELNKMKVCEYGDGWTPYYPKGWIDAGVASDNALFIDLLDILEIWKKHGRRSKTR